jgi:hypothetical protein
VCTYDEFARFMRTGVAAGGRELPVMSGVARGRFSYLTDPEIRSLYDFLESRLPLGGEKDR